MNILPASSAASTPSSSDEAAASEAGERPAKRARPASPPGAGEAPSSRLSPRPAAPPASTIPPRPRADAPAASGAAVLAPSLAALPTMPAVSLPTGEPPAVLACRQYMTSRLAAFRSAAAQVHARGESPDHQPALFRKLDKLAATPIVAALNAKHRELKLAYVHNVPTVGHRQRVDAAAFGSVDWQAFIQQVPAGRWRVLMDNESHNLALDLCVVGEPGEQDRRSSVVMFNPSPGHPNTQALVQQQLAGELNLPPGWPLLLVDVPAQKSERSCRIFALSMALKSSRDDSLDRLHEARLAGRASGLALEDLHVPEPESDVDSDLDSDPDSDDEGPVAEQAARQVDTGPSDSQPPGTVLGQAALEPAQVAGPTYMKHAQSRTALSDYIAKRGPDAQAPVNRDGQNLLQRHDAHRVRRDHVVGGERVSLPYSASIEIKRLHFLDLAIRHAAQCPPQQALSLARAMRAVDEHWVDKYPG